MAAVQLVLRVGLTSERHEIGRVMLSVAGRAVTKRRWFNRESGRGGRRFHPVVQRCCCRSTVDCGLDREVSSARTQRVAGESEFPESSG